MSVASPARQHQSSGAQTAPRHDTERDRSRSADRKSKGIQDAVLALVLPAFAVNILVVVALFAGGNGFAQLDSASNILLMLGRLSGLLGVNLCLVQLMLMARVPNADRLFGMERLTRWHRIVGHASFDLILLHVACIAVVYTQFTSIIELIFHTQYLLMATASLVCFTLVVASSIRAAKRRLRHETWHFIHFYAYLAIALALPHQIFTGATFAASIPSQVYWTALYTLTVGSVVVFRFVLPVRSFFRHNLRVAEVRRENNDTVSILISGNRLHELNAEAGQYFNWRFLDPANWTQIHPYSLSAAPPAGRSSSKDRLRITVKQVGDGTKGLEHLEPGTRVMAEGPYGAFTQRVRTKRRILLVAGGVGVTPIRALLESLPARVGDISMIYRAHSKEDLVLIEEIRELALRRRAFLHVVTGSRREFPPNFPPLGPDHLRHVAPDIAERDIYVCGSVEMTDFVVSTLAALNVPRSQIHRESFSF